MDHCQPAEHFQHNENTDRYAPLSVRYRHRSQLSLLIGCFFVWAAATGAHSLLDRDGSALLWHLSSMLSAAAPAAWFVMAPYFWLADPKKGFCFTESEVIYRTGWLCPSTTTIPFKRVQHIEVKQGLLDRPFGLHRLIILPAGKGIIIPGLSKLVAEQLRSSLLKRIGVEDEQS